MTQSSNLILFAAREQLIMTGASGTGPYNIFGMLFERPLTGRGVEMFASGWEKVRATLGGIIDPAGVYKGER